MQGTPTSPVPNRGDLQRPRDMKRFAVLAFKLTIAGSCLALAGKSVRPATWSLVLDSHAWLGLLVAAWLLNQLCCGFRFWTLARGSGVPVGLPAAMGFSFAGFFLGTALGGFAANDAARIFLLRQTTDGVTLSKLVSLVILDRALGFLAFAAVAFVLSFLADYPADGDARAMVVLVRAAVAILLLGVVAVVGAAAWFARVQGRLMGRFGIRGAALVSTIREQQPSTVLFIAFPLSIVAVTALVIGQGTVGALLAGALGERSAWLTQSFLAPASIIISILPLVPAGIGIGQLSLSGLYEVFSLYPATAVALTSMMQAAQVIVACLIGTPSLMALRSSRRIARERPPLETARHHEFSGRGPHI
jgi:uncharacterized membrane protein YbhN (UPF0104 family)